SFSFFSSLFFYVYYLNRYFISFPTRRSSDLFIYYPDLFSSSSGKDTLDMPAATSQPIQPEMQLSDTIARKDTVAEVLPAAQKTVDRKSTRLNSSHVSISYAVFCLKKKNIKV